MLWGNDSCLHTRLFAVAVRRMHHLNSHTPALTRATASPAIAEQECNCPALLRLHSFTFAPTPNHHLWLVSTSANSAMPQKWHERAPFIRPSSWCTIGGSWLRTLASTSALALLSSELSSAQLSAHACQRFLKWVSASVLWQQGCRVKFTIASPLPCWSPQAHTLMRLKHGASNGCLVQTEVPGADRGAWCRGGGQRTNNCCVQLGQGEGWHCRRAQLIER